MKSIDINPKKNAAYSPNLYKWLKKHERDHAEVFLHEWVGYGYSLFHSLYLGNFCCADPSSTFLGGCVSDICHLRRVSNKLIAIDHGTLRLRPDLEELYKKIGRCAFDPAHKMSFTGIRWNTEGEHRTCLWCGVKQEQVSTVRVYEYKEWVTKETPHE